MFHSVKNVHIMGIGGIGISALAQWLVALGKNVSGCDSESSPWIKILQKRGISITIGQNENHISRSIDLLVYSLAIPSNHPEIKKAKRMKIRCLSYPETIGIFTRHHRAVTVCGTHGKTTTSAMLAKTLQENQYDPHVVIGTRSQDLHGSNFRNGKNPLLVLEACEYRRAFLNYQPQTIVMTNIEHDHFDSFPSFSSYIDAFKKFADTLPKDGYFFGNTDDPAVAQVVSSLLKKKFPQYNLFTFGTKKSSARFALNGTEIYFDGKREGNLALKITGLHNRMNALAAYAVCRIFGMKPGDILYSLDQYEGSARRLECKGIVNGVRLYDDYGHHPTEVQATLQALREMHPKEKVCVVFQPHQYSRTKKLLKEFSASFQLADTVIIPNIYAARDSAKVKKEVSTAEVVSAIKKHHADVLDGEGLEATAEWLKKHLNKYQVVLTMGAGDVWKIYELLTK